MALKGEARTNYMREYMRRRRSKTTTVKPAVKPGVDTAPRARQAEPEMTLDMISTKTGREQAELFMRQQAKRFEAEVRRRVQADIMSWQGHINEALRIADRTMKSRKGALKGGKPAFNLIRRALHPDTCKHISEEDRNRAVQTWEEHKTVMLPEAEAPTPPMMSMEEMRRRREEVRRANSERSKAAHAKAKAKRQPVHG